VRSQKPRRPGCSAGGSSSADAEAAAEATPISKPDASRMEIIQWRSSSGHSGIDVARGLFASDVSSR